MQCHQPFRNFKLHKQLRSYLLMFNLQIFSATNILIPLVHFSPYQQSLKTKKHLFIACHTNNRDLRYLRNKLHSLPKVRLLLHIKFLIWSIIGLTMNAVKMFFGLVQFQNTLYSTNNMIKSFLLRTSDKVF